MSFIAVLDGNEMKWKIERKIKRSGERPRDKREVIPPRKKVVGNKDDFLAVNIGKRQGTRVRNESLPARYAGQRSELFQRADRHASDSTNDEGVSAGGWFGVVNKVNKCHLLLVQLRRFGFKIGHEKRGRGRTSYLII